MKIAISSLYKPFHDVIIILFSTSSINFECLPKKEKNYKILHISRTKRV